jgi:hypothetical protein
LPYVAPAPFLPFENNSAVRILPCRSRKSARQACVRRVYDAVSKRVKESVAGSEKPQKI